MSQDQVQEIAEVAVELEMSFSEIVKEISSCLGCSLISGFDYAAYHVIQMHRAGNKKATGIAERWNANDPTRKIRI